MAILFLPPPLISLTFSFLQMPSLETPEMLKLEKLNKYFKKRWLARLAQKNFNF